MLFPIPPRSFFGKDTHAFMDNVFSDEEINKILALPEWHTTKKGSIGGSTTSEEIVKENFRETDIAWLYPSLENKFIWEKLTNAVADINSKFFHFELNGCYEPIQLGIYHAKNGGHYDWHTDSSFNDKLVPRKLSMSLILSDSSEFEGGQLQLKTERDIPINVDTPKGRAWFFPSYILHRVSPVTKGVRRSLVIWFGGPQFK